MKKLSAFLIIVLCLFTLTRCGRDRFFPEMSYGFARYTDSEVEALFWSNEAAFDEMAKLLINRADYWDALYREWEWHMFMVNWPRNNEFFSDAESAFIESFFKQIRPYEIACRTGGQGNIPYLCFVFPNPDKTALGMRIIYIGGGSENAEQLFYKSIYKPVKELKDGWYLAE